MSYQEISSLSQSWGLVFLVIMFVIGIAYALWPSNKKKFDEASKKALDED